MLQIFDSFDRTYEIAGEGKFSPSNASGTFYLFILTMEASQSDRQQPATHTRVCPTLFVACAQSLVVWGRHCTITPIVVYFHSPHVQMMFHLHFCCLACIALFTCENFLLFKGCSVHPNKVFCLLFSSPCASASTPSLFLLEAPSRVLRQFLLACSRATSVTRWPRALRCSFVFNASW